MSVATRIPTGLFADGGIGPLRLLVYLLLAVALMVTDHRTHLLKRLRAAATSAAQPLYILAGLPARIAGSASESLASRTQLVEDNRALREALLVTQARLDRLQAVQQENLRLRELLRGMRGLQLSVQLANVMDVDLDPFRHRILIDAGANRGAREGLALIDSQGVVGQILEVSAFNSTALLISDPNHSIPVQVVRTGLRTIAYGTGRTDALVLPSIPQSADIAAGDQLVTSGLGGRFPAGLAVGEVTEIATDDTRLFLVATARPAARLDRSGQLLLLWTSESAPEVGPPIELMSAPPAPNQEGG
jgi:rod shape-determining protein MreC